MARILKISLFLLLVALLQGSSAEPVEGKSKSLIKNAVKKLGKLPGIIGQVMEIYEIFEGIYDLFSPKSQEEQLSTNVTDDRLDMLNDKMDQLSQDMKDFEDRISNKMEEMAVSKELQTLIEKFYKRVLEIDTLYKSFQDYTNNPDDYRDDQLESFARTVTAHDKSGVTNILVRMHDIFATAHGRGKNIPMHLTNLIVARGFMCEMQQSPQQIIRTLFQTIMLCEIKGFAMLTTANEILDTLAETSTSKNKKDNIDHFQTRMDGTFGKVRNAMSAASREVWSCDPMYYPEEEEDYARIGPVFQPYAMYESDARTMDENKSVDCYGYCSDITFAKHYCRDHRNCKKHQCSGNLRNCDGGHSSVSYCLASDDYRRYTFLNFDNNKYGTDQDCDGEVFNDEYRMDGLYRCDYCMCTCEDTGTTIKKFFSLREVTSDVRDNKVITGAQIVSINNIFHIQIKQGVLLKNGRIDSDSESWKDIEEFSVTDKNVRVGQDYFEVTWDSKRIALDLINDSVKNREKRDILVGIQFNSLFGSDTLYLTTTRLPFNFKTGKLPKYSIRSLDVQLPQGGDLSLDNRVPPTQCRKNNEVIGEDTFVNITMSDLKRDAGQNILPYIDTRAVEHNPPVPLWNIALFVRGDERGECGGYLALKLTTYDFEPYMVSQKKNAEKLIN